MPIAYVVFRVVIVLRSNIFKKCTQKCIRIRTINWSNIRNIKKKIKLGWKLIVPHIQKQKYHFWRLLTSCFCDHLMNIPTKFTFNCNDKGFREESWNVKVNRRRRWDNTGGQYENLNCRRSCVPEVLDYYYLFGIFKLILLHLLQVTILFHHPVESSFYTTLSFSTDLPAMNNQFKNQTLMELINFEISRIYIVLLSKLSMRRMRCFSLYFNFHLYWTCHHVLDNYFFNIHVVIKSISAYDGVSDHFHWPELLNW